MAQDLNVVALVGRLTRPCEMRYTNSGFAIASFSLAVNRKKKAPDGSWNDSVSFFDLSYFGKAAEGVSQYLIKGQQVSIQGYLEQQSWETNGQKRNKVVIIVNSLTLLSSPKDDPNHQNPYKKPQNSTNNGNINNNNGYNPQGYQPPQQNQGQQRPQGIQNNVQQRQGQQQQGYGQQDSQGNSQGYQKPNYGQQIPQKAPINNYNQQPVGPEDYTDDIPF